MNRDLDLLRVILLRIEEAESNIENRDFYDLDNPLSKLSRHSALRS